MNSRRRVGAGGAKLGQLGEEGDEAGDGAERRALAETVLATLCCSGGGGEQRGRGGEDPRWWGQRRGSQPGGSTGGRDGMGGVVSEREEPARNSGDGHWREEGAGELGRRRLGSGMRGGARGRGDGVGFERAHR
jgi:hypothetical protein